MSFSPKQCEIKRDPGYAYAFRFNPLLTAVTHVTDDNPRVADWRRVKQRPKLYTTDAKPQMNTL